MSPDILWIPNPTEADCEALLGTLQHAFESEHHTLSDTATTSAISLLHHYYRAILPHFIATVKERRHPLPYAAAHPMHTLALLLERPSLADAITTTFGIGITHHNNISEDIYFELMRNCIFIRTEIKNLLSTTKLSTITNSPPPKKQPRHIIRYTRPPHTPAIHYT